MSHDRTRQAADFPGPSTVTRCDFLGSGVLAGSALVLSQTLPPSLGGGPYVLPVGELTQKGFDGDIALADKLDKARLIAGSNPSVKINSLTSG